MLFWKYENNLKGQVSGIFCFFSLQQNIIFPSVHPVGSLLHTPRSGHSTAGWKGPAASPCTPYFSSFLLLPCPCHSTQVTQQPPSPFSRTVTVSCNVTAIVLSHVPSSSSVTPPGLNHQDREASVLCLVLVCWEICTPALRSGHLQPRREVGCQVRQKYHHHLGSQESSGRARHPALWPDSYWNQQIPTDCLISMELVFSDVRTALSVIPLFFNHI